MFTLGIWLIRAVVLAAFHKPRPQRSFCCRELGFDLTGVSARTGTFSCASLITTKLHEMNCTPMDLASEMEDSNLDQAFSCGFHVTLGREPFGLAQVLSVG